MFELTKIEGLLHKPELEDKSYTVGFIDGRLDAVRQSRVPGLRDAAPPSDVKVFKLNPDGTKGELVRTEPAFPDKKARWIPNGGNYVT